jgi:hypothetical protein
VPVHPTIPATHPAFDLLEEFGGLAVRPTGRGEECAALDIAFQHLSPEETILGVGVTYSRPSLLA